MLEELNYFQKDNHQIILGDALIALTTAIPDSSIDLIFADPPYNIGKNFHGRKDKWDTDKDYLDWCYQWLGRCIQKLKSNGSFYVMASTQAMPYFDIYLLEQLNILSRIVWYYDS